MKQLDLKPVGLTDRMEHNATAANFAQIEDAVNSNAITAEEMYAELNGKLAAEANVRAEADKELDGNINDLQKRTASLEAQVKKLDEIIFGTEYINDTDKIPLDDSMTPGKDEEINDTEVVSNDYSEVEKPDHEVIADEVN